MKTVDFTLTRVKTEKMSPYSPSPLPWRPPRRTLLYSLLAGVLPGNLLGFSPLVLASSRQPWLLDTWEPPFDYESSSRTIRYAPLEAASRKWRLCAAYPHLKDSYWLSVNFGMVEQAKKLGIALQVVEAGGYPNLDRQISQVRQCASEGAHALIIGTVSYHGLTEAITEIAQRIPVIAAVNDIDPRGVTAKAGVSWVDMGHEIGAYLARIHPAGSKPVKLAWFPGPRGAGWVDFVERGFRAGITGSSAEVVVTKWGDTGTEIQLILIEEALEEHPDIDFIVGSAVTADAAVGALRARGLTDEILVLADYFTHAVYRGIKRGRVVAAPTDSPVMQGRIAIDQAVRALEGKLAVRHAGPKIEMVDRDSIGNFDADASLAPAWFSPTFAVE